MKTTLDRVKNRHHNELCQMAKMQAVLLKEFQAHGCKMVETPVFEEYDRYSKAFPHLRKQFVKTVDSDGNVIVLRPDATMPLVRALAQEDSDSLSYLKLAYITNVFLDYQGRHRDGREFLQGGVEILGSNEPDCDSEVIVMAVQVLARLGLPDCQVDIGSVAFNEAFYQDLDISDGDKERIRAAVEARNLDRMSQIVDELGLKDSEKEFLLALPMLFGPYDKVMPRAKQLCQNRFMAQALERLDTVIQQLKCLAPTMKFHLDFGFANRLTYYTDTVFTIYVPGAPYALVEGGRYDTMSAEFGVDRPACGFGINLSLVSECLAERSEDEVSEPLFDVLIKYTAASDRLLRLVQELREEGLSVVCCPAYGKVQLSEYAIKAHDEGQGICVGDDDDASFCMSDDAFIKYCKKECGQTTGDADK